MSDEIRSPMAVSGVVTLLPATSMCMDEATHMIHSVTAGWRLKARSPKVVAALDRVADGKQQVTIMAYPVAHVECFLLSVYDVAPIDDVIRVMDDRFVPFPWRRMVEI